MAWTQEDLDALEKAIKSGAVEVEYSDKKIRYRSLKDMMALRSIIMQGLGLTTRTGKRILMSTRL